MYIAARNGNVDLLNMLIDAGGDVNIATVVSLYTMHVTVYTLYHCSHTNQKHHACGYIK